MPDAIQPGLPPEPSRGRGQVPPPLPVDVRQPDSFVPTLIPYRNPKALISYYCGVFALIPCVGLALGPVALVLGIMGAREAAAKPQAKGMAHAVVGIVLGSLALLANLAGLAYVLFAMASSGRRGLF
jgi:hypothetical protein